MEEESTRLKEKMQHQEATVIAAIEEIEKTLIVILETLKFIKSLGGLK